MSEDASDFEQFVSTRTAALLRLAVLLTADVLREENAIETVGGSHRSPNIRYRRTQQEPLFPSRG